MKIVCAPPSFNFAEMTSDLDVFLYAPSDSPERGSAGKDFPADMRRERLAPVTLAWDLLSVALGVHSADLAMHRKQSPDGWTRNFDLSIAVSDVTLWTGSKIYLQQLLDFLTTDTWRLEFLPGAAIPKPHKEATHAKQDSVVLLSGGVDSLVGAIDLEKNGKNLLAVSQNVRGDGVKQAEFAGAIGRGIPHIQLTHTIYVPDAESPASQRSRSILFLAYGVLAATCTSGYLDGGTVTLYVCENGFIALNPPLTANRVGSLSTRTTHPVVLSLFQKVLDHLGIRVTIENPYATKTKGEMLAGCSDQALLKSLAAQATSCGRFKQYAYKHCGRCVPCLVRRAAFRRWGVADESFYVFADLGRDDAGYAGFDDVRSALIAAAECKELGVGRWLGATLSSPLITRKEDLRDTAERGLMEVRDLLVGLGVE